MSDRSLIEDVSRIGEGETPTPRLTRADWLEKALEMLINNGLDAVRITRLAEMLSVTRGSFYWHFRDRAEVLNGILELWDRKNTAKILAAAGRDAPLEDAVLALFEVWLDPHLFDPDLDFAIRAWGRGDVRVQGLVRDADERRLLALKGMFERHGFDANEAETRARNFYYMQMGYYALEVVESMAKRLALLPSYFASCTGQPLTTVKISTFRDRIYAKPHLAR